MLAQYEKISSASQIVNSLWCLQFEKIQVQDQVIDIRSLKIDVTASTPGGAVPSIPLSVGVRCLETLREGVPKGSRCSAPRGRTYMIIILYLYGNIV